MPKKQHRCRQQQRWRQEYTAEQRQGAARQGTELLDYFDREEVQVKNAEGQVLLTYDAPPISRPDQFSVAFGSGASELNLQPYANGSNTIHIYARLSNGELLEAYSAPLKIE